MTTVTITAFLEARIAEDEADADRIDRYRIYDDKRWNVARVLAECEAKRRIVELHVPDRHLENWYWTQRKCSECGGQWHVITPFGKPTDIGPEQGCATLRLLTLPYADHPDYRDEWRP